MNEIARRRRLAEIASEVLGEDCSSAVDIGMGTLTTEQSVAALDGIGAILSPMKTIDQLQTLCTLVSIVLSFSAISLDEAVVGTDAFCDDTKARILQRWEFIQQRKAEAMEAGRIKTEMEQILAETMGMTRQ
jgi:hypothetical protein